jgi:hypothetical protein
MGACDKWGRVGVLGAARMGNGSMACMWLKRFIATRSSCKFVALAPHACEVRQACQGGLPRVNK